MKSSYTLKRSSASLYLTVLAVSAHPFPSLAYRIAPKHSSLTFTNAEEILIRRRGGGTPDSPSIEDMKNVEDLLQSQVKQRQLEEDFVQRRWSSMMHNCIGNWSGTIGWYDSATAVEQNGGRKGSISLTFVARPNNNKLNMRFSFLRNSENPETAADWIVYHAREQGSRDQVLIEQGSGFPHDSPQTLYCFDGGILGRTGRLLATIPVVEHGFWDGDDNGGQRRTAVVTYDRSTLQLNKICFLQLQKKPSDLEFDVSETELNDADIISKGADTKPGKMTSEERSAIMAAWGATEMERTEVLDGSGLKLEHTSHSSDSGALDRLFGNEKNGSPDEDTIMRLSLPNGIVVACPDSISNSDVRDTGSETFMISMGYKRLCGQIQILELFYNREDGLLQTSQATWYKSTASSEVWP